MQNACTRHPRRSGHRPPPAPAGAGALGGRAARTAMTSARDGELVGRQLGDYQLEALLGSGGMAEVYRARELALGREVAVKVLPASLAHDRSYVERFRAEAQRVAALQHPHIVPG